MSKFNGLVEREIPRLRRYARALTRSADRADDLVQETLLRAISKSHLWQTGTDIRAWLFTIMHNHYVNMVRRAIRDEATVDIDQMSSSLVAVTDPTASSQLRELDQIAERGVGAVGLDIINQAGLDSGVTVGRAKDGFLCRSARGCQAVGPAVLIDCSASDHGIDRVAVAQGPRERLQGHDPHAFTAYVAIGLRVKCPAMPVGREEPALREAGEDLGLEEQVRSPGQRQLGFTVPDAPAGE